MPAVASPIPALWSSHELPSAEMIAPTYLKELTSSSCSPFTWISTVTSWPLLIMTLPYYALVFIPNLFSSIAVDSWSSLSVYPIRSISYAKRRFLRCLLFILRELLEPLDAKIHLNISADEHLPACAENPWTTWKALNRLRTQVGRSRVVGIFKRT